MKYFKFITLIFFICTTVFASGTSSKELKKTGERWYDWDGSAWIVRLRDDYLRDTLGIVTQMNRYTYNSSGVLYDTKIYTKTNYPDYYTLRYYYSWEGYKEWGHYSYTYRYDLEDTQTAYIYNNYYNSIGGGEEETITYTYTYDGEKLSVIDEASDYTLWKKDGDESKQFNYQYRTTFLYDSFGRISSELKQATYDQSNWIDKERTIWTYDGSTGAGINEIYKNTVWIFQNKKTRCLDNEYKIVNEYRDPWSWGFWVKTDLDYLYYNTQDMLFNTQTYGYDPDTDTYSKTKMHSIFYTEFSSPLTIPQNIITSVSDSILTVSWDPVSGASGYSVYSSEDPYGTFEIDTTGIFNDNLWTAPVSDTKKFYKVTATNEEK